MMHYLSRRKKVGYGYFLKEECLCLNGSFDENKSHNLTRTTERIDCPRCLEIMKMAQDQNITLEVARTIVINNA